MLAAKAKLDVLTQHEKGPFCVDAVYRDLDGHVSRRIKKSEAKSVYAYEDGALESFRVAKQLGIQCHYDLPIGYWRSARRLLDEERRRWPEWSSTMPAFRDSEEKLARKDEELRLADSIFVASTFTAKTLEDFPEPLNASIHAIPYGFPPPGNQREFTRVHNRKLRLLFVGGLSQRKGIADVFEAAKMLEDFAELTVIGRGNVSGCAVLQAELSKHRWIPSLPHDQVLGEMRKNDVLLFPSLFEGFGLVITEAMSQGTPVITTVRTAGMDIIEHGKSGWLIEPANTDALIKQLGEILEDPDQIASVGYEAMQCASRRSWKQYGTELATKVAELCCVDVNEIGESRCG